MSLAEGDESDVAAGKFSEQLSQPAGRRLQRGDAQRRGDSIGKVRTAVQVITTESGRHLECLQLHCVHAATSGGVADLACGNSQQRVAPDGADRRSGADLRVSASGTGQDRGSAQQNRWQCVAPIQPGVRGIGGRSTCLCARADQDLHVRAGAATVSWTGRRRSNSGQ